MKPNESTYRKQIESDNRVFGSTLSFREKMVQDIIPKVLEMLEKEREHLKWLIDNHAPMEFIVKSENMLNHYLQRYREYMDYLEDNL